MQQASVLHPRALAVAALFDLVRSRCDPNRRPRDRAYDCGRPKVRPNMCSGTFPRSQASPASGTREEGCFEPRVKRRAAWAGAQGRMRPNVRSHSGARIPARTARNCDKAAAMLSLSVMQIKAVRPLGVSTVETNTRIDPPAGPALGVTVISTPV